MAVAPLGPKPALGRGRMHRRRGPAVRSRVVALQVVAALLIGAVGVLAPTLRTVTQAAMATETRRPAQEAEDPSSSTTVRVADPATTSTVPADPTTTTSIPTTGPPDAARSDPPATDRLVVAEDTRDFNLIGVTLPEAPAEPVLVRTARGDGVWSPWQALTFDDEEPLPPVPGEPVPEEAEEGNPGAHSEPLWVGDATRYELNLTDDDLANARVHLVYETTRQVAVVETARADAAIVRPAIHSRSAWGARAPRVTPSIASSLRLAVVHHSVGTNSYSSAQVPALLRSIQAYHMDANGWNDIGYNFAVDRFGRIWEARAGGTDRAVIGGHAAGFNTGSTGVVVLGNFETGGVTTASVAAVSRVLAWKFAVHRVDPRTAVAFRAGSGSPRYPPGTVVALNRIVGHRDVGRTACPGRNLYAQLGGIRSGTAARWAASIALPSTEVGSPGVISPTAGRVDLFGRSGSGTLTLSTASTGGSNRFVADLGGRMASQPAAESWGPGRVDVFIRGTDNALWHKGYNGSWSRWQSLGGRLTSGPAVASWGPGRLDVFVRGGDTALWHKSYSGGRWSGWESLGGILTSSPAATSRASGAIDVAARGGADTIYHRSFSSSRWSAWRSLGGVAASQPALTSPASGRLELVVRGPDGAFWLKRAAGGTWSGWTSLGGRLSSGPGATSSGDDMVVMGRSPNRSLYLRVRASPTSGWGPWVRLP